MEHVPPYRSVISLRHSDISGGERAVIRTIISLNEEDKAWLDRHGVKKGLTMTELVRRSVRLYRQTSDPADSEFAAVLGQTRGVWKNVGGLQYQRRLRR